METLTLVDKPAPSRTFNYLVMFAPVILVIYLRIPFSYLLFSPTVMGALAIYASVYLLALGYFDLTVKKAIGSLFVFSLLNYIAVIVALWVLYYFATVHMYSTYVISTTLILLTFLLMNLRPVANNEETLRQVKNNKAQRMQGFNSAIILDSVKYAQPAVSPIDWGFFKREKFFSYIIGDYYSNAQSAQYSFFLIFYIILLLSLGITTGIGFIQVVYIFFIFFGVFLLAFAIRVLYAVKYAQVDVLEEIKHRLRFKVKPQLLIHRIITSAVVVFLLGVFFLISVYDLVFRAPEPAAFFNIVNFDLILISFYLLLFIGLYLFRELWILITWRNIPIVPLEKSVKKQSKQQRRKKRSTN